MAAPKKLSKKLASRAATATIPAPSNDTCKTRDTTESCAQLCGNGISRVLPSQPLLPQNFIEQFFKVAAKYSKETARQLLMHF